MRFTVASRNHAGPQFTSACGSGLLVGLVLLSSFALVPTATAQVPGIVRPILNPVVDAFDNRVPREAVDTEIWSTNLDPHFQLLDREGNPITLADWLQPTGTGQITNVPEGTALNLEMSGLIPNGLYTLWGFFYDNPPYNRSEIHNFPARVAEGAVGLPDGSENEFRANADGTATFAAIIPPGPLSIEGEAPGFVLDGYSTYLIGATYHNDDMSNGGIPGPFAVGHFSVEFSVPEPSSVALTLITGGGLVAATLLRRRKAALRQ